MSNKVVITTDTGSDLRPENLKKYHIDGMIPFHINLGDKSYKDFYECQPNDLFKFFEESNQVPKTAACSPNDFLEFFEPFAQQGCDIVHIAMNSVFSSSYSNSLIAAKEISEKYGIPNDVSVVSLSRFPDVFTVRKAAEDEEQLTADVLSVADKALASFLAMRGQEGEKLRADILSRAETILSIVEEIEERSPQTVREYEERLLERIRLTLDSFSVEIDEQRVLTEVAVFADKVAVAEETVRLRSHFEQLQSFLRLEEPVGRKIDFIIQEMNREANTIGSKVQDAVLAHKVVAIKGEIEKIREQVQNLE